MKTPRKKTWRERMAEWLNKNAFGGFSRPNVNAESDRMLAELQAEQSRLSVEVERTLAMYDDRTRALAKRLRGIEERSSGRAVEPSSRGKRSGANAADRVASREIDLIRSEQTSLWRTVRRLQAALRATRDLETELREWASRVDETETPDDRPRSLAKQLNRLTADHPDHPSSRIEIVASELRLRGRDPFAYLQSIRKRRHEGSAEDVEPLEACLVSAEGLNGEEAESPPSFEALPEPSAWQREESDHLLREIAEHAREARRMQAHAESSDLVRELARTIADFRRYHGYLKLIDRSEGMKRDRLEIANI